MRVLWFVLPVNTMENRIWADLFGGFFILWAVILHFPKIEVLVNMKWRWNIEEDETKGGKADQIISANFAPIVLLSYRFVVCLLVANLLIFSFVQILIVGFIPRLLLSLEFRDDKGVTLIVLFVILFGLFLVCEDFLFHLCSPFFLFVALHVLLSDKTDYSLQYSAGSAGKDLFRDDS